MSTKPEVVEEAYTILSQLGGSRFLVMTGADKLMAAGRTASNPNPWLRMDLRDNKALVNRMKNYPHADRHLHGGILPPKAGRLGAGYHPPADV